MSIDARTASPFSSTTLPPFSGENDNREQAISESIRKYTVKREAIEAEINARNEANSGKIGTLTEVAGEIIYQEELKPYEPMNPLPKNDVVGGVDLWKVRDKEGKPFYVEAKDYDMYMEAKGKDSDRPGAPKRPEGADDSDTPDQPTSTTGGIVKEPVAKEVNDGGATPIVSPTPTPAPTPAPVLTPTATAPTLTVSPTDQPGKKSADENPRLNLPQQRDRQKDGGTHREKRPDHRGESQQHKPAVPSHSAPQHVKSTEAPASGPAKPKDHSSRHDIVRHKIEEKFNRTDEKTTEPAPQQLPKIIEPRPASSGELTTVVETVSDPVVVGKPIMTVAPKLPIIQSIPAQPAQIPPIPVTPPADATDSIHAKYNDFDSDDQDVIPLKEL
jgi:hypothetical protein